jgi:hypothetical protein
MRHTRLVAAGGLVVVLATAGVALATKGAQEIQAVSATFSAKPTDSRTSTCGDVKVSRVLYTGTSTSSDSRLAGNLRLSLEWVVNTKTGDGFASGELRVTQATGDKRLLGAKVEGVVSHTTLLDGLLRGSAKGQEDHAVRLLANFSLAADSAGVVSGELGADSPVSPHNAAVLLGGKACGDDQGHDNQDNNGNEDRKKKH